MFREISDGKPNLGNQPLKLRHFQGASERIAALHKEALSHDRYRTGINTGISPNLEVSKERKDRPEVIEKEWCRWSESNRHGVAPGGF